MGPKSLRHQSAFPYGSSQVSKTHPSQESCQTMIDGNSTNIHYIRQSPFRIQVSVFKTLYTLYFLPGVWEVRHEQFKVQPHLLACLDQYHPLNGQKCNTSMSCFSNPMLQQLNYYQIFNMAIYIVAVVSVTSTSQLIAPPK